MLRNTGWMLSAEGCARATRLVAIIAMAATLPLDQYGIAMLALTLHEMIRLVSRIGSSARIVQCDRSELEEVMSACLVLNWIVAFALTLLQIGLSSAIAGYYGSAHLAAMLSLMALSYLLYPIVAIKVAYIQRRDGFKQIGIITAVAVSTDNISTAVLLLSGAGLMSIAIAKVLAAFVWVIGFGVLVQHPESMPTASRRSNSTAIFNLLRFTLPLFTTEIARNLRNQIDVLLGGKLLSPEIFGLYTFAKSAGIGFGLALINAFTSAIYPRLASAARKQQLTRSAKTLLFPLAGVTALVLVQAALAPVYVPVLFSNEFAAAGTLVRVLCLMAITFLVIDLLGMMLRVRFMMIGETALNLGAVACIAFASLSLAGASAGAMANGVTFASFIAALLATALYLLRIKSNINV